MRDVTGLSRRRNRQKALACVLAPVLAGLAASAFCVLDPFAGHSLLPLLPVVAAAAWLGGLSASALATASAGLSAAYLCVAPAGSLRVDAPGDAGALAVFAVGGLMVGAMIEALQRRDRRARVDRDRAERAARWTARLDTVTAALSRARTAADVVDACVLEAAYDLNAAAGAMLEVEEDGRSAALVRGVGLPDPGAEQGRQVSLAPGTPFGEAVRTRAMIVHESRAERQAAYGDLADAFFLPEHEGSSVLPLVGRGRVMTVLALARTEPGWTEDDREFLEHVTVRAARALERAREYDRAERARAESEDLRVRADRELTERLRIERALRDSEARYRALAARTSRLHVLTASLSEAVTVDAVAAAVVRHGQLVVGSQGASVTLLVDEGARLQTLAAEGASEGGARGSSFPVEPGLCLTEAVRAGRPVFVPSFAEWQRQYGRSAARAADGGYASTAALPLVAKDTAIGAVAFFFTAPVNFDEGYQSLLTSVAQHCAQALDRARLYEADHRARAEAEAANRLKDNFLSTVSHELRTPLNAILGWSAMLRLGTLDEGQTARAIKAVHDNAARQAQLVDELLDLSRIMAGRVALDLQEFDLGETILSAVESILPLAEARGLEVRLGPPVPVRVLADARRLHQVFLNLVSNAVKFTPAGGRIEVRTVAGDSTVEVEVSDTGCGIAPEFLPHVFDQFRQADSNTTRTHGGLGLGLSIARHLVEAHAGRIRAASDGRDRGATFVVTLPLAAPRERPGPALSGTGHGQAQEPEPLPRLDGLRVLVVDDEAEARDMAACILEGHGAAVSTAASARDALEVLARAGIDVLLADVGMPGEDGYSLMRRVRSLASPQRAVPAAAVTAFADARARQQALAAGFQGHLAKPIDASRLVRAVASLSRPGIPSPEA